MRMLEPLRIGPLELRNRVVMGAMHTRLETLDRPLERLTAFYRMRAAGQVGLILTGGVAPHAVGRVDADSAVLEDADGIDRYGYRHICEAVHAEGGAIALQILHAGRYAMVPEPVGPSSARARINPMAPRALSTAEVWQVVDQYANTARLARDAGFDGVEIMGSEGYLLNEFTSAYTNDRSDEFGGDRDGRFRLPVEIVKAVRAAVGPDFLVIYRISVIDLVPNGLTGDDVVDLALRIEAAGADALNTGIGWHESTVPTIAASVPRAAWMFAVRRVKQAVAIPVIASNRINSPDVAEAILTRGDADMVSMARPLLADPDFVRKLQLGRADLICPCIACNQACLDAVFNARAASCLVNPRAGREVEFSPTLTLPRSQRVAVVGAGPAGLAFAITAAERGHAVTLYEASDCIGGQLNLAGRIPGKSEFEQLLRYFHIMLGELAVDVRLSSRVGVQELIDAAYDRVVIATGTAPRAPEIRGLAHASVVSYADLLTGRATAGDRVAIIGAGGIGFDVAQFLLGDVQTSSEVPAFLAQWGVDVTLENPGGLLPDTALKRPISPRAVTLMQRSSGRLGRSLGRTTGWILRASLTRAGLRELAGVTYESIDDDGLHFLLDGEAQVLAVDTIVICAGQDSERTLHDALMDAGIAPLLIGGAHQAGELDAASAIDEATRAAFAL